MARSPLLVPVCLALAAVAPARARAADPADLPPSVGTPTMSGIEQVKRLASPWEHGSPRFFLSSIVDAGFFYLRPQLAAGWGKPHWSWIGAEVQPHLSSGGPGVYGGLRAGLPFADLRVGGRYSFALDRRFLQPRESYTRDDVERIHPRAGSSRYFALESELAASLNVPGGNLFTVASAHYLLGVPDGWLVFEESLHVVVDPPFVYRGRLGYAASIGDDYLVSVGPIGEVIGVPDREALIVRAGPAMAVKLTPQLEAVAAIALVVASPDATGLLGADLGRIGLRWRWATGADEPPLPW